MLLFAPQVDAILENKEFLRNLITSEILQKLEDIYSVMTGIKTCGDDDQRTIWIEVPRGTIRNFGSYREYKREQMVETREEFTQMWLDYYPRRTKWYSFTTAKYRDERFFYLNSQLVFKLEENNTLSTGHEDSHTEILLFLDKLDNKLGEEIRKLTRDPESWNSNLEANLSYNLRFGRIKRKEFWKILGKEARRLDKQLGKEGIRELKWYIDESNSPEFNPILPSITADDYFYYCELGYKANGYFQGERQKLTTREQYTSMADGRDSGLRKISGDSEQAFQEWFHGSGWSIGHPWEICRGGNSTHISLYVSQEGDGWKLTLAGSSQGRVVETVKIALALYHQKIPFVLREKEEIYRMITGNDYIGIVPEYLTPRYCHSFFPKEDRIIGFMNLFREDEEKVIKVAFWYPVERVEPV